MTDEDKISAIMEVSDTLKARQIHYRWQSEQSADNLEKAGKYTNDLHRYFFGMTLDPYHFRAGKGIYSSENPHSSSTFTSGANDRLIEVHLGPGARVLDLTDASNVQALRRRGVSVADVYRLKAPVAVKYDGRWNWWVLKGQKAITFHPFDGSRLKTEYLVNIHRNMDNDDARKSYRRSVQPALAQSASMNSSELNRKVWELMTNETRADVFKRLFSQAKSFQNLESLLKKAEKIPWLKKIFSSNKRITAERKRLEAKYTPLETLIASLNEKSTSDDFETVRERIISEKNSDSFKKYSLLLSKKMAALPVRARLSFGVDKLVGARDTSRKLGSGGMTRLIEDFSLSSDEVKGQISSLSDTKGPEAEALLKHLEVTTQDQNLIQLLRNAKENQSYVESLVKRLSSGKVEGEPKDWFERLPKHIPPSEFREVSLQTVIKKLGDNSVKRFFPLVQGIVSSDLQGEHFLSVARQIGAKISALGPEQKIKIDPSGLVKKFEDTLSGRDRGKLKTFKESLALSESQLTGMLRTIREQGDTNPEEVRKVERYLQITGAGSEQTERVQGVADKLKNADSEVKKIGEMTTRESLKTLKNRLKDLDAQDFRRLLVRSKGKIAPENIEAFILRNYESIHKGNPSAREISAILDLVEDPKSFEKLFRLHIKKGDDLSKISEAYSSFAARYDNFTKEQIAGLVMKNSAKLINRSPGAATVNNFAKLIGNMDDYGRFLSSNMDGIIRVSKNPSELVPFFSRITDLNVALSSLGSLIKAHPSMRDVSEVFISEAKRGSDAYKRGIGDLVAANSSRIIGGGDNSDIAKFNALAISEDNRSRFLDNNLKRIIARGASPGELRKILDGGHNGIESNMRTLEVLLEKHPSIDDILEIISHEWKRGNEEYKKRIGDLVARNGSRIIGRSKNIGTVEGFGSLIPKNSHDAYFNFLNNNMRDIVELSKSSKELIPFFSRIGTLDDASESLKNLQKTHHSQEAVAEIFESEAARGNDKYKERIGVLVAQRAQKIVSGGDINLVNRFGALVRNDEQRSFFYGRNMRGIVEKSSKPEDLLAVFKGSGGLDSTLDLLQNLVDASVSNEDLLRVLSSEYKSGTDNYKMEIGNFIVRNSKSILKKTTDVQTARRFLGLMPGDGQYSRFLNLALPKLVHLSKGPEDLEPLLSRSRDVDSAIDSLEILLKHHPDRKAAGAFISKSHASGSDAYRAEIQRLITKRSGGLSKRAENRDLLEQVVGLIDNPKRKSLVERRLSAQTSTGAAAPEPQNSRSCNTNSVLATLRRMVGP